tara:strand:+ start:6622 stop:9216 length:2595 start_codon:yes stop_codon:yes gene_type:complete
MTHRPPKFSALPHGSALIATLAFLSACAQSLPEVPTMPDTTEHTQTVETDVVTAVIHPDIWPEIQTPIQKDAVLESRIDVILSGMSLEQKVGQVIQADIGSVTPEQVQKYHLGSVLNGGNSAPNANLRATPSEWLNLADAFWKASVGPDGTGIPVLWGTDAVHGHNNIIGATVFPHNIGLGAAGDADLVQRIGEATALDVRAVGMDWTFAPTVAVTEDSRWGRAYESYSEDPALVATLGAALVRGLQGTPGTPDFLNEDHVIATAKHFLGDGGTKDGRDQGETIASEKALRDIHAPGYVTTLETGVQSVMASFSSWQGQKMHGRSDLLTDVLKDKWRFDGMVVGDWNGHGQIVGCTNTDCPDAINAGLDMFMAPDSWRALYNSTLAHARSGRISEARLNDAVRRILRVKIRAGLFEAPAPSQRAHANPTGGLANASHTALAAEAVRKSAVLLKNEGNILPLSPSLRILVAGEGADNLSMLSGGWTLSWQGDGVEKTDFPDAETVLDGVRRIVGQAGGIVDYSPDGKFSKQPDVAIFVFGEDPYAEFRGDLATLDYRPGDDTDVDTMRRLQEAGVPVVAVFLSGRPLWVNPEINASTAFVAAFLPGSQAGAMADVLFADVTDQPVHDFTGRLSFAWPLYADQYDRGSDERDSSLLFDIGYGLSHGDMGDIPELHEQGVATQANNLVIFDRGAAMGGWHAQLADSSGVEDWASLPTASPSATIGARPADLGQQENALRVTWSGAGTGELQITHAPTDLSREVNADFALVLDYAIEKPAKGTVTLRFGCGPDCIGSVDVSDSFGANPYGGVSNLSVPLKCLESKGVDFTRIDTFSLSSDNPLEIIVARIALVPSVNGVSCDTEDVAD